MSQLENKLIDMRELYDDRMNEAAEKGMSRGCGGAAERSSEQEADEESPSVVIDPFFESQVRHTASIWRRIADPFTRIYKFAHLPYRIFHVFPSHIGNFKLLQDHLKEKKTFEFQEQHSLIGVANVFLEVLLHDLRLDYQASHLSLPFFFAPLIHRCGVSCLWDKHFRLISASCFSYYSCSRVPSR